MWLKQTIWMAEYMFSHYSVDPQLNFNRVECVMIKTIHTLFKLLTRPTSMAIRIVLCDQQLDGNHKYGELSIVELSDSTWFRMLFSVIS